MTGKDKGARVPTDMRYVAFCADNNVLTDMGVCIESLFANNEGQFTVYIIHAEEMGQRDRFDQVARKWGQRIEFIRIDPDALKDLPVFLHYNRTVYYKFFLPQVLPQNCHKVLLLDTDIIISKIISEIWDMDISGHSLAAAREALQDRHHTDHIGIEPETYFNIGVMLLNLEKIRKNNSFDAIISFIAENKDSGRLILPDQDALNIFFSRDYLELPFEYNFCYYFAMPIPVIPFEQAKIIHYAGTIKPGYYASIHPLRHIYRDYIMRTPWKQDLEGFSLKGFALKIILYVNAFLYRIGIQKFVSPLKYHLIRIFK